MKKDRINILGVKFYSLIIAELHDAIDLEIKNDRHSLVLNVNVNCLNLAYENYWLRQLLNDSEIVFCEGAGVIFASRLLGHYIPVRITFVDWIWKLSEFAVKSGYTFYYLGALPSVAQRSAEIIKNRFPEIRVLGTHHGYFDKSVNSLENLSIINHINSLKPNILVVGLGMPLQEKWLKDNWDKLDVNIALNGGAVFDYVSGDLPRAPLWMTEHGFEWLGRLLIEPRRLWRRYLIGNPLFLYRVTKQRFGLLDVN